MGSKLTGRKVAMLVADGFEQVELTSPKEALEKQGATVEIISLKPGEVEGWNHFEKGDTFRVHRTIEQVSAESYDALVLPGGVANPDQLRTDMGALEFVRAFFDQRKPVAAICHAPWTLIDAGVVNGRKMTSYHSIKTDLIHAGADWVDEEVVVDNGLVTSRSPEDLKAFNAKLIEEVAEGIHVPQGAGSR